jgi:hypothetical protein
MIIAAPFPYRSSMLPTRDTSALDLAACQRPSYMNQVPPEIRGRREDRALASPMARLQQRKQAAVTTGLAETPGLPCAMVYGLYEVSPGTGLFAPVCA